MPAPKPILNCQYCGHDLSDLLTTPWVRTCPECGKRFDPDFIYDVRPDKSHPPKRDHRPKPK